MEGNFKAIIITNNTILTVSKSAVTGEITNDLSKDCHLSVRTDVDYLVSFDVTSFDEKLYLVRVSYHRNVIVYQRQIQLVPRQRICFPQTTLQWFGERAGQFHDDVIWRKEPITAAGKKILQCRLGEKNRIRATFERTCNPP